MDRREFLTGVLALAGGAVAQPLFAHRRSGAVESTPWTARATRSGRTVDEDVRVIFRWRS